MKRLARLSQIAFLIIACSSALLAEQTGSFTKILQISGTPDIEISTGSGDIVVHTGSSNTLTVNARIKASEQWFGGGSLSAAERVKRIENNPPITQNGNMISIGHITDPELRHNVSINYDVTLPASSRLRSDSGSGDITVDGVSASVKISTGSGNVNTRNLGDEVRITTGSGDVKVEHAKGPVRINTGSGNVEAPGIAGAFYAETGSGDITLYQDAPGTVVAHTGSGNVRLHHLNGGLEAHSGSGDIEAEGEARNDWTVHAGSGNIELKLPAKAAFTLDAHSSSGSVTVNHPITVQGVVKPNRVQGKVGEGGPLLNLQTSSGEIRVD